MKTKILTQLVNQFQERHQRLPDEIWIHPVALTVLALRRSVAPKWNGVPVKVVEVRETKKASTRILGITVVDGALRGFDV